MENDGGLMMRVWPSLSTQLGPPPPPALHVSLHDRSRRGYRSLQLKLPQLLSRRRGNWCSRRCVLPPKIDLLSGDAPFAIAIGTSMLNSLLFPLKQQDEQDEGAASDDARFTIMTIIAFIPFFNWLSWVFALLDTHTNKGKARYAFYAAVYLAPYIKTNLSLSPDESWLPIASIILCIIHIQLEASIATADLHPFTFFNHPAKQPKINKRERLDNLKLPSHQSHSKQWKLHTKPFQKTNHVHPDNDDDDDDDDDGTDY